MLLIFLFSFFFYRVLSFPLIQFISSHPRLFIIRSFVWVSHFVWYLSKINNITTSNNKQQHRFHGRVLNCEFFPYQDSHIERKSTTLFYSVCVYENKWQNKKEKITHTLKIPHNPFAHIHAYRNIYKYLFDGNKMKESDRSTERSEQKKERQRDQRLSTNLLSCWQQHARVLENLRHTHKHTRRTKWNKNEMNWDENKEEDEKKKSPIDTRSDAP